MRSSGRVDVAVGDDGDDGDAGATTGCPRVLHLGGNLAAETEGLEGVRDGGSGDGGLRILVWGWLLFLVDGFEALADPFKVF